MFFAKKTICLHGHKHDSKAEAAYCEAAHVRQERGEITGLRVHPVYEIIINGKPVKMANGHIMRYTGDVEFCEDGQWICVDVKPKGGFDNKSRDVPVKLALLRHIYPHITWKIVK